MQQFFGILFFKNGVFIFNPMFVRSTLLISFLLLPLVSLEAQVVEFISSEIGPSNSSNRDTAESFGEEWRDLVRDVGGCEDGFETGNLEGLTPFPYPGSTNNNTVELTVGGIGVTISNRDLVNFAGTAYADLIGDPGGVVSLGNGASLQDSSPRPASLYNSGSQPDYLNEISGSGSSRNAYLIEFATPIQSFGAWFGDLETNPLGTEAFIRLFDAGNNQIGTDTIVPADTAFLAANGFTTSDCGAPPSGSDVNGCGNSTTRFIGFVSTPTALVKSMLVVVGDDDQPPSTYQGLTEHISMIGPSLNADYSCTDVNLTSIKRDVSDPVEVGENIVFEVLVTNFGTQTATGVELQDLLPPEYAFVEATADNGGTCTESSGTVDCSLGTVANGEIVTVTIEVFPTTLGTFLNQACVSSVEGDTFIDDNCSLEETSNILEDFVNLAIFKNDLKDPVEPGSNIVFDLTVLNMGALTATGVQVQDILPPEYSFVSASADNGGVCVEGLGQVDCSLGSIAQGEIVTVTVEVTSSVEGIFTNAACVASEQVDFDDLNNCDQEATMVMPFSEPEVPAGPPGLASVLWNGFCDQQNFISMGNTCDDVVSVRLDLFGSDGGFLSTDLIALAPAQQLDYSVNNMAGFSVVDYGRVDLTSNPSGCVTGEMGLFAPIGNGQSFYTPILESQVGKAKELFLFEDGSEKHACYASFNTFQPSINPIDQGFVTSHWLQLVNLDRGQKQDFIVNRYDMFGAVVAKESLSLAPGARVDIAAGHEDPTTNRYGLVEIVPQARGANYSAQLFRYGLDQTVVDGERMSSFSLSENCSTGHAGVQYLTISRGAGAANWLEISNLSSDQETILVELMANSGERGEVLEFLLQPRQTIHVDANSGLRAGESGVAQVYSQSGSRVFAKSTSYLYRFDGRILASDSVEGRKPLSNLANGSVNSFRNQLNWLRLFNLSDQHETIDIIGFDALGNELTTESIQIASKTGQDIDLNTLLGLTSQQTGRVSLKISGKAQILADIIRVQHDALFSQIQDIEVFSVN